MPWRQRLLRHARDVGVAHRFDLRPWTGADPKQNGEVKKTGIETGKNHG